MVNLFQIVSSVASMVLTLIGVSMLRGNRPRAYLWFQRSNQVQMYVTQVCVLYHSSLRAIGGLFINIAIAIALSFMLHYEEVNKAHREVGSTEPVDAQDSGHGEELSGLLTSNMEMGDPRGFNIGRPMLSGAAARLSGPRPASVAGGVGP